MSSKSNDELDASIRELDVDEHPSADDCLQGVSPGFSGWNVAGRVPSRDETEEEGEQLFVTFVNEELKRKHLKERVNGDDLSGAGDSVSRSSSVMQMCKTANLGKTGKALRKLADEFEKSPGRKRILEMTKDVSLEVMQKDEFFSLLKSLFEGGITQEKIVVLFFFCSDLAIRALQEVAAARFFHQLVRWALVFLKQEICIWVQSHGGWAKVLSTSVDYAYKMCIIVGALACTAAAAIYIKKNL